MGYSGSDTIKYFSRAVLQNWQQDVVLTALTSSQRSLPGIPLPPTFQSHRTQEPAVCSTWPLEKILRSVLPNVFHSNFFALEEVVLCGNRKNQEFFKIAQFGLVVLQVDL